MFQKSLVTTFLTGAAFLAGPLYAQTENYGRQDVAVQAIGSFVKTTTEDRIENKVTKSGGVLASYRYFFSKHHGIEASYSYALNTQRYISQTSALGVNTHSHEVSGAYVFRAPLRRITPFALGGVGALIFDPKNFSAASKQFRAAFVYGGGADFNLTRHIFARVEYRGFVYKSPTYDLAGLAGVDRVTHRAMPSIGFGYTF
jgi:opacity protein-like surface antigen